MRTTGLVKDYVVKWLPYLVRMTPTLRGDLAFIETVTLMTPLDRLDIDYTPSRVVLHYRNGKVCIPLQPGCCLHRCFKLSEVPIDKPPSA